MPTSDLQMMLNVLEAHIRGIRTEIQTLKETQENTHVEMMDMFKRAFPDGDLAGHMRFHQQLIDEAKSRKELRAEIFKKIAAGSVWSIIVFMTYKGLDIAKAYFHVSNK